MSWLSRAILLVLVVPMNAFDDSDNYAYVITPANSTAHYSVIATYANDVYKDFKEFYTSEGSKATDMNLLIERDDDVCERYTKCDHPYEMKLLKKNETHFFAISYQNIRDVWLDGVCANTSANRVYFIDIAHTDPDFKSTNLHIWHKCGNFVLSDVDRVMVRDYDFSWLWESLIYMAVIGFFGMAIPVCIKVALIFRNHFIRRRRQQREAPPDAPVNPYVPVAPAPQNNQEGQNVQAIPMVDLNDPPVADENSGDPLPNPENAGPEKNEEIEEPESSTADGPEEPLLRKNDDEKSPESL